jgi:signal peptidase II
LIDSPGRVRWLVFGGLALVVVVADQLSKAWIVANVDRPIEVVGDLLRFVLVHNDGGIFGLFGNSATILGLASTLVIALILVYQWREGTRGPWVLSVALGLLLGGAIGNLVDRLRYAYVVDFVDMGIGDLRFYTFNIADAAISTALLIMILLAVFGSRLPWRLGHGPAES